MATFGGGTPTFGGNPNFGKPPGSGVPPNFGSAEALARLPQCAVSLGGPLCCGSNTNIFTLDVADPSIWYLRESR